MGRFTFRLPDVGEGTAEAEIVAWHVAEGDVVEEDAPLVDVMTDKATVEITSPVSGKVVVRRGEPGEMFAVGGPIVEFDTDSGAPAAEPVMGVPNPTGQRNVEAREAPPTTPEMERPEAPSVGFTATSPRGGGIRGPRSFPPGEGGPGEVWWRGLHRAGLLRESARAPLDFAGDPPPRARGGRGTCRGARHRP